MSRGQEGCSVGIQGAKLTNTLLFLDDVQLLGRQGVQGAGGVQGGYPGGQVNPYSIIFR